MVKRKNYTKDIGKEQKVNQGAFTLLPGIILVTVWPFLMHRDIVRTHLEEYPWYPKQAYAPDFFLHSKSTVFLILVIWMLAVLIVRCVQRRTKGVSFNLGRTEKIMAVAAGVYLLLTLLSGVLSKFRLFVFTGFTESYETVPVIAGYLVTFLYGTVIRKDAENSGGIERRSNEAFKTCFMIGAGLTGLLGTGQLLGWDFWLSRPGRWLIFGKEAASVGNAGQTAHTLGSKVYLAMYNPNYAAVYLLVILPVCLAITAQHLRKRQMIRFGWDAAAVILLGVSLYGTGSKTAPAVLVLMCLTAILLWKGTIRKKLTAMLAVFLVTAAALAAGSLLSGRNIVRFVWKKAFPSRMNYRLKDVTLQEDTILLTYKENRYTLQIAADGDASYLQILDETGQMAQPPGASFETFYDEQGIHVIMYYKKCPWHFVLEERDGRFHYYNMANREDIPVKSRLIFGRGHERAFTNRMYIWGVTAGYLPGAILTGYGPETFAFVFPQNDYVMKCNLGLTAYSQTISRPHSLYLQIWMNSGAAALFSFLVFIGIYFKEIIRRQIHSGNQNAVLRCAAVAAAAGFLLMGFMNDSIVAVTPALCLICGYFA